MEKILKSHVKKGRQILNNNIVVFNQKVAGYLMLNGFVLKKIEKSNKIDCQRNVFIFNDTEQIREKISKFKI